MISSNDSTMIGKIMSHHRILERKGNMLLHKIVVPRAAEAYDARARGPNRKFQNDIRRRTACTHA
jgi:hypothetical protein